MVFPEYDNVRPPPAPQSAVRTHTTTSNEHATGTRLSNQKKVATCLVDFATRFPSIPVRRAGYEAMSAAQGVNPWSRCAAKAVVTACPGVHAADSDSIVMRFGLNYAVMAQTAPCPLGFGLSAQQALGLRFRDVF